MHHHLAAAAAAFFVNTIICAAQIFSTSLYDKTLCELGMRLYIFRALIKVLCAVRSQYCFGRALGYLSLYLCDRSFDIRKKKNGQ